MPENQNNGARIARQKVVMYRAVLITVVRDNNKIQGQDIQSRYFTSKSKAVDALRGYAEKRDEAVESYCRYGKGSRLDYFDLFVSLGVYEESEGALLRTEQHPFLDVMDGQVTDYSEESPFQTLP